MDQILKSAIETYQCPGCAFGSNTECGNFKKHFEGVGCGGHCPGSHITQAGTVFLGMPKGFNRTGVTMDDNVYCKIAIFNAFGDYRNYFGGNEYDKWNIPVWKHLNSDGHTLVRYICPRKNHGHIHVFLENCMDRINCFEVDQEMIDYMD